jgi:hypothetical protein
MNEAAFADGGAASPPPSDPAGGFPAFPRVPPCEVCRITGSATFAGIAGWLLYQRSAVERTARLHRGMLAAMSAGSLVAAVIRWRV